MIKKFFGIGILLMVLVFGIAVIGCGNGSTGSVNNNPVNGGGGGDDVWTKLSAGSGKWVKDTDDTTWIEFKSLGSGNLVTYTASSGGSSESGNDWTLSGSNIKFYGQTMTITFSANNTKAIFGGLTANWYTNFNGNFTKE